jgi:hypothetical protein
MPVDGGLVRIAAAFEFLRRQVLETLACHEVIGEGAQFGQLVGG